MLRSSRPGARSSSSSSGVPGRSRQGSGETDVHYRCKEYLAAQLTSVANSSAPRLLIGLRCTTRQGGAALPPYWSCTERRVTLLAESWRRVATEYTVAGIGRFDVALLSESGKLVAALEVFHKGPVSATKAMRLQRHGIRWAELRGSHDLYDGPHAWTCTKPLPVYRAPFKVHHQLV
jgi:hypothetical protein